MKRARSTDHVDTLPLKRRSPRLKIQHAFPFLELLPEMQDEVIVRLVKVRDRACLARTCRALKLMVTLPVLPMFWRDAWRKQLGRLSFCRALFRDLIDFGILTWPHAANSRPFISTGGPSGYNVSFQWIGTAGIHRVGVSYHRCQWTVALWHYDYSFRVTTDMEETVSCLNELSANVVNKWRDTVASK